MNKTLTFCSNVFMPNMSFCYLLDFSYLLILQWVIMLLIGGLQVWKQKHGPVFLKNLTYLSLSKYLCYKSFNSCFSLTTNFGNRSQVLVHNIFIYFCVLFSFM